MEDGMGISLLISNFVLCIILSISRDSLSFTKTIWTFFDLATFKLLLSAAGLLFLTSSPDEGFLGLTLLVISGYLV